LLNLNPTQIPKNPPTAVKIIEKNENTPSPHRLGKKPPIADPTIIPSQIICFDEVATIYYTMSIFIIIIVLRYN